jgi:hypothetical protein
MGASLVLLVAPTVIAWARAKAVDAINAQAASADKIL